MSLSRRSIFPVPALLAAGISAESRETPQRPTAAAPEVWARTELYFGTNRPGNQVITESEFSNFLELEVTPRFPDGLTLLRADGQFKTSAGELIREKSFLLILFYSPRMVEANKGVEEIRQLYKLAFQQESVLRVDSFSFVSF